MGRLFSTSHVLLGLGFLGKATVENIQQGFLSIVKDVPPAILCKVSFGIAVHLFALAH